MNDYKLLYELTAGLVLFTSENDINELNNKCIFYSLTQVHDELLKRNGINKNDFASYGELIHHIVSHDKFKE